MKARDLKSTLRCEQALRTLAKHPEHALGYLERRFGLERGDLALWLGEWNGGKKELKEARIAEVKAELGGASTVRVERAAGAAAQAEKVGVIKGERPPAAQVALEKPAEAAWPPAPNVDLGKWLEAQKAEIRGRVTCFVVRVTPALASSWLRLNGGNRKPSRSKIRRFAASMVAGKWMLNGETVKFSGSGRLLDGQSRLMAIEIAGVPVELEVRHGLPELAQQSMDAGELRKGQHTLEMLGEANPSILAPALKLLWLWCRGWLGSHPFGSCRVLENAEIAPLLAQHPGLRASAGWTVSEGSKCDRYLLRSEAAFFHYLLGTVDAGLRDTFFEALLDGLGLTKQSPAYHLRERLLQERQGEDTQARKRLRQALVLKAWSFAQAGQPCTRVQWTPEEEFPGLAGGETPERQPAQVLQPRKGRVAR